ILKIDKSFVDNIPGNSENVAIIKSIISLAKNLNLKVVAEGVETIEQLICLREYNCEMIQGYYFSKPITHPEIEQLVLKKSWSVA
ncbi:hypothetical protein DS885_15640, partial [Psychromonas sp. B3M02]|uniref:EAL domain-containing protein n=1 Tax=Psychromonas sp. B3M02 TaxID=2267226 RepID=UPI000E077CDF